jgi:hypothetical protein
MGEFAAECSRGDGEVRARAYGDPDVGSCRSGGGGGGVHRAMKQQGRLDGEAVGSASGQQGRLDGEVAWAGCARAAGGAAATGRGRGGVLAAGAGSRQGPGGQARMLLGPGGLGAVVDAGASKLTAWRGWACWRRVGQGGREDQRLGADGGRDSGGRGRRRLQGVRETPHGGCGCWWKKKQRNPKPRSVIPCWKLNPYP